MFVSHCSSQKGFAFANRVRLDSHWFMDNNIASVTNTGNRPPSLPPNRIRWRPAWVIVVVALLSLFWVRFVEDTHNQGRNLHTVCICLAAILLLLLWCLFFSRFRWRVRLLVLGVFLATATAAALSLNIHGVTGDLVPILEWRWHKDRPRQRHIGKATLPSSYEPTEQHSMTEVPDGYPQFLGPSRNATLPGPVLARDWTARPPQQLWRHPIGAGWSGFAVARGFAVTQEQNGSEEMVVCYNALSGKFIWSHADTARYFTTLAGEGPRATPTIDGCKVYALGATGILNCLDLQTGELIWSRNIILENGGQLPEWGLSVSPLVLDKIGRAHV